MTASRKNFLSGKPLHKALEEVCRGLVYISETDWPVTSVFIEKHKRDSTAEYPFPWEKAPPKADAEQAARQFFDKLTADKDWHSEKDKRSVRKYRRIEKLMFDNLSDVELIRRGRVRVDIFLIGKDSDGNIAGIKTRAVET